MIGRAIVSQRRMRFAAEPLAQAVDEAGLADARLTGEQDRLPFALRHPLPPVQQQPKLLVAPNEGGCGRAVPCVEPAFGGAFAKDAPSPYRLSEAFEAHRAKIPVGE